MFSGIGSRGGKKDLKQRIKNTKVQNKKKENLEIEKKEIDERELERKKKERIIIGGQRKIPEYEKPPILTPKKGISEEEKQKIVIEKKKEANKESEKQKEIVTGKQPIVSEQPIILEPTNIILPEEPIKKTELDSSTPPKIEIEPTPIIEKRKETLENKEEPPIVETTKKVSPTLPIQDTENIERFQRGKEERQEKEEILEFKVATELERLLKENRYQLKRLYTELDIVQKSKDSIYQVSDTEEAIEEIERLLTYLEQIKKELEVIHKSHNLDHIYELKDSYFTGLVEEYKSYVKNQQVIDDAMKDLKRSDEYTDLMKRILEFERMQEELSLELEEKKNEFEERDIDFELLQDEYLDLEKASKEIENLIIDSERYLKEIENKVSEAVEVTKRTEIKLHYAMGVLTRALLLISFFKMNPKPKANLVTAVETIIAVNLIQKLLTPRRDEKTITEYHYQDYHSMITNALSDMDSIDYLVKDGIHQIQDLKKTFEREFASYETVFPEYKDLIYSITQIEKNLLEREDYMHRMKDEMKKQLNKNNEKVLEYERLSVENN